VPIPSLATVFDFNQDVSCDGVVWEGPGLPVGGSKGCEPFVHVLFALGPNTFTVHATDATGLTMTQTRTIDVVEAPPNSKPVAFIKSPAVGAVLNPNVGTTLVASGGDPNIDDCIGVPDPPACGAQLGQLSLKWSVRFGPNLEKETNISPDKNGLYVFNPAKKKIRGCGPMPVDLVATVTNSKTGSTTVTRRVTIAFPPC
jgi:hypothetical protein